MAGKQYDDYVQKGRPWYKLVLEICLSNVGLLFCVMLYAVVGNDAFLFLQQCFCILFCQTVV